VGIFPTRTERGGGREKNKQIVRRRERKLGKVEKLNRGTNYTFSLCRHVLNCSPAYFLSLYLPPPPELTASQWSRGSEGCRTWKLINNLDKVDRPGYFSGNALNLNSGTVRFESRHGH
jgi:hypothetical protein